MELRVLPTIPPTARNKSCTFCNHGRRERDGGLERVLDTGIHIEWEGFIVVCETCVTHMGRMIGLLTPADVEALAQECKTLLEQNVAHEQRISELERVVDAQRVLLAAEGRPIDEPDAAPAGVPA
jgi:hypothetical protein